VIAIGFLVIGVFVDGDKMDGTRDAVLFKCINELGSILVDFKVLGSMVSRPDWSVSVTAWISSWPILALWKGMV